MHRTIAQLHLGAEIEPVKDGTPTDWPKKKGILDQTEPARSWKSLILDEKSCFRTRKPPQSYRIVLILGRLVLPTSYIDSESFR